MKTFNDYLTTEFIDFLSKEDIKEKIKDRKIDIDMLKEAFKKLLENKEDDHVKTILENFIVNQIKEKKLKK